MNTPESVLLAWSGGKDSALALERLRGDESVRVAALVTTITTGYDRIAIHGVRRSILRQQAERLELPLIEAEIAPAADNVAYEAAFADALAHARAMSDEAVDTIAFGDLFLADVRAYREAMLAPLGWRGLFPLWGENTTRLARRFVDSGYRAILCCVDTQQLDGAFCGRDFDAALLGDLPDGVDPCGENGEFHTCVHAGPIFHGAIALERGERVLREDRFQYVDLVEARTPGDRDRSNR
jgi:uncharacterized protein (TIGR00290 family)